MTEFGPVPVEWQKISNHSLKFKFEIPPGIEALIRLPEQGTQNQVILNDREFEFISSGRFMEFKVSAGAYQGIIKGL